MILFLGVACGGGDGAREPLRWLSAGDSFSSAEGVPDPVGDCARTEGAFAPAARERIDADLGVGLFAHVACTGAELDDFMAQWQEAGGGRFDLVTMTLGGNDAGFGDLLRDCLGQDDILEAITGNIDGDLIDCDRPLTDMLVAIDRLAPALDDLYDHIESDVLTSDGYIIVVGYPQLFTDPEAWVTFGRRCFGFDREAATRVRTAGERLASITQEVIAAHPRVRYLDTAALVAGHELCSDDEWINGIGLGLSNGTMRYQSSFHLDSVGHAVVADALVELIARLDW